MAAKLNFYMRTTSVGCTSEPQEVAAEALKSGDVPTFTDLINNQDVEDHAKDPYHWINAGRKEDEGLSLAELAIHHRIDSALSNMISLGVPMDLVNPITGVAPIHVAAEIGSLSILQLILDRTKIDFDVNTKMAKRKRGHSALHVCADNLSEEHLKCLELLLKREEIDVDAKDTGWTVTPVYLAAKAKNREAVVMLIEMGADVDLKVGKSTIRTYLESWIPDLDVSKIRVKRSRSKETNLHDRMMDIVRNTGDGNMTKNFLQFRELSLGIGEFRCGYADLMEVCCKKGLIPFVEVLLRKNADPDTFPANSYNCPVIEAAEMGDVRLLCVLRKYDADFTSKKKQSRETVLHSVLNNVQPGKESDYLNCLEYLLDDKDADLYEQIKRIINWCDILDNTALHYATEKWPAEVVRKLLQHGAHIGIKNSWGEIPISRISPEVMEEFLDEDCLHGSEDIYHKDLAVTFKYDFLAPDPASLPDHYKSPIEMEACKLLPKNCTEKEMNPHDNSHPAQEIRHPLPETEPLWYMGQSKEHRHLLRHPVITSFLWFKWERIRSYFNRNMRLYILFVFLLTWHIFMEFGGISQKESIKDTFYILYVVFFAMMLTSIVCDWYRDISDGQRAQANDDIHSDLSLNSPLMLLQVIAMNWVDLLQLGLMSTLLVLELTQHLRWFLVGLLVYLILRELIQMAVSLKRYFLSVENWVEVTMIALVIVLLYNNTPQAEKLNRHLAAIALVLAWAELITLIGKHPKLVRCNVYVTMFYRVMHSFFSFLLWYSLFLLAFSLGFYIMLHKDTSISSAVSSSGSKSALNLGTSEISVNTSKTTKEDDDEYKFFNKPWLSFVKTSSMFIGELEFSDIPIDTDSNLAMLAYAFFLAFVFLIVVVLMNLLNGLAVNDTGDIQQKAEIYTYISRVETISYMESILLGDPFDFLSNVPKFLKDLPSMSMMRQLHHSTTCRKVFTKLGAKSFLLFYSYLPTKQVTVHPNASRNGCCLLTQDEMGREIIRSAKQVLVKKTKTTTGSSSNEVMMLKQELDLVKEKLAGLDQINKKLDLLLNNKKVQVQPNVFR